MVTPQQQLINKVARPGIGIGSPKTRHWKCTKFDISDLNALGVPIRRLVRDSRCVKPGDIFVAYPGEKQDGRQFIANALRSGCKGVLWESDQFSWNEKWRVPNLGIPQLRANIGVIAAKVYGYPSEHLWMIGVTGTNGKTSCSHWIAQALTARGKKTAVIGTLGCGFLDKLAPNDTTTPDAVFTQTQLKKYVKQGARAAALEASSHGLSQGRLNGVEFDVALLTNLTRDHLDYHGNARAYKAAKAKLFRFPSLRYAIVNFDDKFGLELAESLKQRKVEVIGYGFKVGAKLQQGIATVVGCNLCASASGLTFDVSSPWGNARLRSPLLGKFNASNLLGSLSVLLVSGIALRPAVTSLQQVQAPNGRMQCVGGGTQALVVIDYAHTPDALEKVLYSLRELLDAKNLTLSRKQSATRRNKPKLICVFGCGGERDRGKRPLMGSVASRCADELILTNDNPRNEDPEVILQDIIHGARSNYRVIPDRAEAIFSAITSAKRGDVVLIAGKGDENYQEIMGKRFPFNDFTFAQSVLAQGNH